MKQHITVEDLKLFSNKNQIKIATLFGQYGNCCNTGGESMNLGKLCEKITIGKMIELLTKNNEYIEIRGVNDEGKAWEILGELGEHLSNELCDALWESVKQIIKS